MKRVLGISAKILGSTALAGSLFTTGTAAGHLAIASETAPQPAALDEPGPGTNAQSVEQAGPLAAEEDSAIVAPVPIDRFTTSPGGVELRTGNYLYSATDLSLGDPQSGLGISLTRTTDSKQHTERFAQFSHNWEIYITEKKVTTGGLHPQEVYQMSAQGSLKSMTFRSASTTASPNPVTPSNATLERIPSGSTTYYRYTDEEGTVINFSPFGSAICTNLVLGKCAYATDITLPNGVKYILSYDNLGGMSRLRRVTSSTGYELVFEYTTGSNARPFISKACALNLAFTAPPATPACPAGSPSTTYQYAGDFLSQVVDTRGASWSFQTTYTDRITPYTLSFFKPGYSEPYLVNNYHQTYIDHFYRAVTQQNFLNGPVYDYSYGTVSNGDFNTGSMDIVSATYSYGSGNNTVSFGYYRPPKALNDKTWYITPRPKSVSDPLGRTYTADYCIPYGTYGGCRVVEMQYAIDPEGIRTDYTHDSYLNIIGTVTRAKPGSGLADISRSWTFSCLPKSCRKPTSATDARGAVSHYTYAPEHGGMLTQMAPPPATGDARPLTIHTYVQKYAYFKNTSGALVAATTPTWLIATSTLCQTVAGSNAPVCDGSAAQTTTTYEYGPDGTANNLLVRGVTTTADGQTLRTCQSYDELGRQVSRTKPSANLTNCP